MNVYTWEINGVSLEFDIEDADNAEKYQKAFEKFGETEKIITSSEINSADFIREYCKMFRNLYDDIFGEGTSDKIFSKIKDNSRKYDEIYAQFVDFISGQSLKAAERRSKLAEKYSPKRK